MMMGGNDSIASTSGLKILLILNSHDIILLDSSSVFGGRAAAM
jgi:hypothetical protein